MYVFFSHFSATSSISSQSSTPVTSSSDIPQKVALINTTGASSKIIHPQEDISLVRGITFVILIQKIKAFSVIFLLG